MAIPLGFGSGGAPESVHRIAGTLLVPYLAWVLYATSLNAGVAALN